MAKISLPTALAIIFMVLRLTHHIDWPWIWVLAPLWIGASIGLFSLIVIGAVYLVAKFFDGRAVRRARARRVSKWRA